MSMLSRRIRRHATLSALTLALSLGVAGAAQAQVKYFDHVPTPAELQAALNGQDAAQDPPATSPVARAADGRPPMRMRGIEWGAAEGSTAGNVAAGSVALTPPTSSAAPAIALPVNFDYGTARVSKASLGYLQSIVTVLEQNPDMHMVVEGHTDAAGNPRSNLMLSWERAFAVFHLMVEKYGIDPARLQPVGKGSSEPLTAVAATSGMNRRVQFRIVK